MKSKLLAFVVGTIIAVLRPVSLSAAPAVLSQAPASVAKQAPPAAQAQRAFATPEEAARALIEAAALFDVPALKEILGPDGADLVSSDDPVRDKTYAIEFAARAREKNSVALDPADPKRAILSVGEMDWPLPIPIVSRDGRWVFDSKAGHDEVLYRRIGANELNAIEVCRGFVEAQLEYASTLHDGSRISQYAQRLFSTPGRQDGLYWTNPDGTPGGPISEAVARAIDEGYSLGRNSAYRGYYFQLLKGQGPAARGGQLDYIVDGAMIGGFALIAVPADYRVTGVQTFIVNHEGIVYQKDLGPDTLSIAKKIERYNPDKTWRRTDDEWGPGDFVPGK